MIRFEWDEDKNRINQLKHGSFTEAVNVFADPHLVFLFDRAVDAEELIRIISISARKASTKEERIYEESNG
jgi:uncharacterized DUF497 family protein